MLSSTTTSIINHNKTTPFQVPTYFGNQEDDIFVHQDYLTPPGHFFPNVAIDNVADSPFLVNGNCADPFMVNLLHPQWKKPDVNYSSNYRQRKILTAQGPRDRRVRLSIQIARQFFDLQDTLGFDKASKTVDWLLTKSKSAIEEAVKMKHAKQEKFNEGVEIRERSSSAISTCSTTATSNSNVLIEKGSLRKQQNSIAKELRAKARERARERTKAKNSIRKLKELKKLSSGFGPIFPRSWNCQLSSHSIVPYFNSYEQNYANSKQVPFDSLNITQNWDISNGFSQESPSTADLQYMATGCIYK